MELRCTQAQTRMKPFDQAEEEDVQLRARSNSASGATRTTAGIIQPPLASFESLQLHYILHICHIDTAVRHDGAGEGALHKMDCQIGKA